LFDAHPAVRNPRLDIVAALAVSAPLRRRKSRREKPARDGRPRRNPCRMRDRYALDMQVLREREVGQDERR